MLMKIKIFFPHTLLANGAQLHQYARDDKEAM